MAAYVIVGVDVTDPEAYSDYSRDVPATLAPYDGRFLVRGGDFSVLEGAWPSSRIVVLEFPSIEQAHAWHESPAYQAILPIRQQHAKTHFMVAVEGAGPGIPAPNIRTA
jgi:uncharacterized protein (DUF1330 family)